jgi:hypothetical protein
MGIISAIASALAFEGTAKYVARFEQHSTTQVWERVFVAHQRGEKRQRLMKTNKARSKMNRELVSAVNSVLWRAVWRAVLADIKI